MKDNEYIKIQAEKAKRAERLKIKKIKGGKRPNTVKELRKELEYKKIEGRG